MYFYYPKSEPSLVRSKIKYDDVVDRSTFKPDSEQTRIKSLTGAGSTVQGIYDDKENRPTNLEIAIRSGKLDKAEISQIKLKKTDEFKESVEQDKKDKIKADSEKIEKARREHLDNMIGFNGKVQES